MTQLPETWSDARDDCQRRYADLMIIDGQEEQDFITDKIANLKIDLVRISLIHTFSSKRFLYFNAIQYSAANLYLVLNKKRNREYTGRRLVNAKLNTNKEKSFGKIKLLETVWQCYIFFM